MPGPAKGLRPFMVRSVVIAILLACPEPAEGARQRTGGLYQYISLLFRRQGVPCLYKS
jgi:hypothetical protein